MTTTSLKLPEALRETVAETAEKQDISAHAFMVAAVSDAATRALQRARFVASAAAARQHTLERGLGYEADAVHAWLRAKAAGRGASWPEARPWRE